MKRLGAASEAVRQLAADLDVFHKDWLRRAGSPAETRLQAASLIREHHDQLHIDLFDEPTLERLAVQAAALLPPDATEQRARVQCLLVEYLTHCDLRSRGAACRVADALMGFAHGGGAVAAPPDVNAALVRGYQAAAKMADDVTAVEAAKDHRLAGDVERLLRVGAAVFAPQFDFSVKHFGGSGPCLMLPVKHRMLLSAKMQRVPQCSRLIMVLRSCALTRIDSLRVLRTFADSGLYDEAVADRCCEVVDRTSGLGSSRDAARTLFNLGTLQHKHDSVRRLSAEALRDTRNLSNADFIAYLQGSAMLRAHTHWDAAAKARVLDQVWRSSKRGSSVGGDWHVDVLHAMTACEWFEPKFVSHAARQLRMDVHRLSPDRWLRLFYSLRDVDVTAAPEEFKDGLRRAVKVRDIVEGKLRQHAWSPTDKAVVADALRNGIGGAGTPAPPPV